MCLIRFASSGAWPLKKKGIHSANVSLLRAFECEEVCECDCWLGWEYAKIQQQLNSYPMKWIIKGTNTKGTDASSLFSLLPLNP